jgi:hypothetical protein
VIRVGNWTLVEGIKFPGIALLGEDPIDMAAAGFSGLTKDVRCRICGYLFGQVPAELMLEGLQESTLNSIGPVLDIHMQKEHGIENGGR